MISQLPLTMSHFFPQSRNDPTEMKKNISSSNVGQKANPISFVSNLSSVNVKSEC